MGLARPTQPPPTNEQAERAERVRSMLARWESDDVAGEPEWNVEDIEPLRLEAAPIPRKGE